MEPLFSFYPIPFKGEPLSESVSRLARLGYDGLELPGEPHTESLPELLRHIRELGMAVTAVCPRLYDPERDLSSHDPACRRQAIDYFLSLVEMAHVVGAPVVIVAPTRVRRTMPETTREQEWDWAVNGLREVASAAAGAGIRLAIEPWNRYETYLVNSIEDAQRLRTDIAAENVGVMADLFHMNIEEVDIAAALEIAGDHLLNVHFADSNRRAPGRGHIAIDDVMRSLHKIGYQRTISVEYLPPKYVFETGVPEEFYEQYAQETINVLRQSWISTKGANG